MRAILITLLFIPFFSLAQQQEVIIFEDSSARFMDISFLNRDTGVVVAQSHDNYPHDNFILHTRDGGLTWDTAHTFIWTPTGEAKLFQPLWVCQYINDSTIYLGGHDGTFYESNNGTDYFSSSLRNTGGYNDVHHLQCYGEDTCLFSGTNIVRYSDQKEETSELILDREGLLDLTLVGYHDHTRIVSNGSKTLFRTSVPCRGALLSFDHQSNILDTLELTSGEFIPAVTPQGNFYYYLFRHEVCT
ncbi:MAG: hypothetical protein AAFV80_12920, partial [Bacteroidota bacterium]